MKIRKKTVKIVISAGICLLMAALLVFFCYALYDCSDYFDNEAKNAAQSRTLQNTDYILRNFSLTLADIENVASDVSGLTSFEDIDVFGERKIEQYGMSCLQFLRDGIPEYRYGEAAGSTTSSQYAALVKSGRSGYSAVFTDMSIGVQCVAVYAPVAGNSEIDGVLAYYRVDSLIKGDISDDTMIKYYCFAESNGSIIEDYSAEGFVSDVSHNAYTYITNISDAKSVLSDLEYQTENGVNGSYIFEIGGESYIVSCITVRGFGSDCFVMTVYSEDEILHTVYSLYQRMIGSAAGIIIISFVLMFAYVWLKKSSLDQKAILDETDPLLGCNTYNKFLAVAESILSVNRISSYAVLYFEINKFTYAKENLEHEDVEKVLKYVATVVKKMVTDNETYGYIPDDCFTAMIHFSSPEELANRIKVISALIGQCEVTRAHNYSLTIAAGVYIVDRAKNYSVKEMVDRASIAEKINKKDSENVYSVYDSNISSMYLKEAEIESKMELALKNREFQIFFQPKLNLEQDTIDGAEVLVRWFEPSKGGYVLPDDFVPIFEVNGFISKVDRYVYERVCEYLKDANERGDRIVPISVNVSRVTATKPDFLSHYISVKQKYGIADGFLVIEFTESFAYENYDTINEIVMTLRSNGFKCSIDDFGSGYSSFNILKELPMDELKLDRLFLNKGKNPEKDDILLRTVIGLGKNYNMKVTAEGVEDREQLNKLKEYHCDVIQGYYYSKPMPMSDFIDFANGVTSISSVIEHHMKLRK